MGKIKRFSSIILFSLILCLSCEEHSETIKDKVLDNITYFKDPNTGLCFAAINSIGYGGWKTTSFTCVPCDSVNNVLIK